MYDCQLPRRWWQQFINWVLRVSRFKIGIGQIGTVELELLSQHEPDLQQKMDRIIAQIEKENIVGTIDKPAAYIHGTLPMFQVLMPSRNQHTSIRHPGDPGFIYYGGGTEHTSLGLVGSPHHLTCHIPDEKARLHSSDVPNMIRYINERINEIVPSRTPKYEELKALDAIWHADTYNEDMRTPVEFFACRIADSVQLRGIPRKQKRILLYTPIYVAYKD